MTGVEIDQRAASEAALIRACQNGRRSAFEPLVRRYGPRAYRFALGMVRDSEDAKDLSQEAFIRAFRSIHRFDLRLPFYPWFYRILRNVCLSHLRNRRPTVPLDEIPEGMLAEEPEQSVELRWLFYQAIDSLAANDREILLLKDIQDHTYREISVLLDIPRGTVMSRLYYARQRLREKIVALDAGAALVGQSAEPGSRPRRTR